MLIKLHKKAGTTPSIRDYIHTCAKPIKVLSWELRLNADTVRKWCRWIDAHDASHCPHTLRTTLSPVQETQAVELLRTLLLSLDDLASITPTHIHPDASRAVIDRLLKREGLLLRLSDLASVAEGGAAPIKTLKDYAPGYLHVDLKELPKMPNEETKSYFSVMIDRASRWVYFEILPGNSAQHMRDFLHYWLVEHCPFKIEKILTNNSKKFTAHGERLVASTKPLASVF